MSFLRKQESTASGFVTAATDSCFPKNDRPFDRSGLEKLIIEITPSVHRNLKHS
ncbi:Uncharacterized protein dnm_036300 [Desulfonema magnum]|uniref:Uncharacterized protein n=1 Tax=Desulfonema magnum TaxID=45655 RepID=A0A975GNB8_9BACT|nr:Uncharacterized protein dnm_036300 [Desulfonema magnum]